MTAGGRPAPHNLQGLPTLTEVIERPLAAAPVAPSDETPAPVAVGAEETDAPLLPAPIEAPAEAIAEDDNELVGRVLAEVQRHADLILEHRLREALNPLLARVTESLVRDLRQELAATLREVVAGAVSQERARRQGR